MRDFKDYYAEYIVIRRRFEDAEYNGDENAKEKARTDMDDLFERVNVNGRVYAYAFSMFRKSFLNENNYLDISEPIRDCDVPELADVFRQGGIMGFTVSSTWSDIVNVIWEFQKAGCNLIGMTEVNKDWNDETKEYERSPAFVLNVS